MDKLSYFFSGVLFFPTLGAIGVVIAFFIGRRLWKKWIVDDFDDNSKS